MEEREIGPGMIANCLSNGCHPGNHFRWLVIRHERGRPARFLLLALFLSGPPQSESFGLSPVTSPFKNSSVSNLRCLSLLPFPLGSVLPAVSLLGSCSAAVV